MLDAEGGEVQGTGAPGGGSQLGSQLRVACLSWQCWVFTVLNPMVGTKAYLWSCQSLDSVVVS